jgi:hypothetical protein
VASSIPEPTAAPAESENVITPVASAFMAEADAADTPTGRASSDM